MQEELHKVLEYDIKHKSSKQETNLCTHYSNFSRGPGVVGIST